MATILVVDDTLLHRRIAGALLERQDGIDVRYAEDGREALDAVTASRPDLVLTDLVMPRMDGLELVDAIRARFPELPVVLMTAHGSEEIAAEALRRGAASYVPKRILNEDLVPTILNILTVRNVLTETAHDLFRSELMADLAEWEHSVELENDSLLVAPLVAQIVERARTIGVCDDGDAMQISMALDEAFNNAIEHGNLEVSSELREMSMHHYLAEVEQRRQIAPYSDRRVHVHVTITRDSATIVIRDEGPGFDPALVPDPTDPENLEKCSGRGLVLIQMFMDEVRHNASGNELTLVKRRPQPAS